jgi:dTDP-4-amino-4,6-dideoxygalactose transaminase
MKNIPLFIPDIQDSDIEAVQTVLRSGMLVQGKNVEALEAAFCAITGASHAVAVSNGPVNWHSSGMRLCTSKNYNKNLISWLNTRRSK